MDLRMDWADATSLGWDGERYFLIIFHLEALRRVPCWMWLPLVDPYSVQSGACCQRRGADVRLLVCRTCGCLVVKMFLELEETCHVERLSIGLHLAISNKYRRC